ncbi:hypothetical protein TL16_g05304 [Triparma laevis f. inornata]|uniref:Uncharacterized protein n=1 Tax=Triparma laevis f. inornata TaxID=1714386 RepID=A0A9W7E8N6_9STRA|nr:hypothetical protein TL16_g05304 [Triparma laevis f. inornata]
MKKVAAMELNTEERVQGVGLLIAALCTVNLLGSYGAEGKYISDIEKLGNLTIGVLGSGCLIVTALWKLAVIKGEMQQEDSPDITDTDETDETDENEDATQPFTEASTVWYNISLVLSMIQPLISIMGALTLNDAFFSLSLFALPFTTLAFTAGFFCQQQRHHPEHMWKLRLHGIFFISRNDEDATTKCVFEDGGNIAACAETAKCDTGLSCFLLFWWFMKLTQQSVHPKFRSKLNLSIEKIARMKVSFRREAQGMLTLEEKGRVNVHGEGEWGRVEGNKVKGKVGSLIVHSGKMRHGGGEVTMGERYVLVGFVDVECKGRGLFEAF